MVQIMKQIVPNFSPDRILLDFEIAAMNAFREEKPEEQISGCFFHSEKQMLIKFLPALAFVPVNEVPVVFSMLVLILAK